MREYIRRDGRCNDVIGGNLYLSGSKSELLVCTCVS